MFYSATGALSGRTSDFSSIGLPAVTDAGNLDGVLALVIEENPIIATAEPKAGERRPEFLHLTGSIRQVTIHTVQNLKGGLAVDRPQIGAGFGRPGNRSPLRGGAPPLT
jgi:hypothetical protein